MPITTKVVSWNPAHGEVYSIQHYVIKFVSALRQIQLVVFSRYSCFLYQLKWHPWYRWNIVESAATLTYWYINLKVYWKYSLKSCLKSVHYVKILYLHNIYSITSCGHTWTNLCRIWKSSLRLDCGHLMSQGGYCYFYQILTAFNKLKIISEVAHDNWQKLKYLQVS